VLTGRLTAPVVTTGTDITALLATNTILRIHCYLH
jgi:hypothetical protein